MTRQCTQEELNEMEDKELQEQLERALLIAARVYNKEFRGAYFEGRIGPCELAILATAVFAQMKR